MSDQLANVLYENGRTHALAAQLIQKGALEQAHENNAEEPERYVHNGPYSLALFQSIGLGLELMMKAALVRHLNLSEDQLRRDYGHDLVKVLNDLEAAHFETGVENLRHLVEVITPPYRDQVFRYKRPHGILLPADFEQVFRIFAALDAEISQLLERE